MSRPRTKGYPVQFRLTLEDDELFRIRADEAKVTPAEFAEMIVHRYCETLRGDIDGPHRSEIITTIGQDAAVRSSAVLDALEAYDSAVKR